MIRTNINKSKTALEFCQCHGNDGHSLLDKTKLSIVVGQATTTTTATVTTTTKYNRIDDDVGDNEDDLSMRSSLQSPVVTVISSNSQMLMRTELVDGINVTKKNRNASFFKCCYNYTNKWRWWTNDDDNVEPGDV